MRSNLNVYYKTLLGLILLLSSCTQAPTSSSPPLNPTHTNGITSSPDEVLPSSTTMPTMADAPTRTPTLTNTVEPTGIPDVPLSNEGPWMLLVRDIEAGYELGAINQDGTGYTVLDTVPELISHHIVPSNASPWFALQNSVVDWRDVTLSLYQLPDAEPFEVISLLSGELPGESENYYFDSAYQKEMYSMVLTRFSGASQTWSPDGRYLALLAALDGPSMDLYIYDSQDGSIDRLTSGPSEALQPIWSPSGDQIILQEVDAYTEMGFWDILAVYAVPIQGDEITLLYEPFTSAERILGWISADTFIVLSFKMSAGSAGEELRSVIRKVNIHTAETTTYEWLGAPYGVLDPESGAIAFFIPRYDEEFVGQSAGLYLANTVENYPVAIAPGEWSRIEWLPEVGLFLALGEDGVVAFSPGGELIQFTVEERLPEASPDGQWLAFYGLAEGYESGIRIYTPDGQLADQIGTNPISRLTWQPNSTGLIFLSDGALYHMSLSDRFTFQIDEDVIDLYWIGVETEK